MALTTMQTIGQNKILSSARLAIEDGDYVMDHKRESGGWSSTINQDINTSRNFKITHKLRSRGSGTLNNGYGLTFWEKDNNNQNHFNFSRWVFQNSTV